MLTIPANMQTALKKNPNQEFRYIIKMGRSLIASPYTASNFYFSSNATFGALNVGITDTSVYPVVPILLNEPQITENLDLREHTSTVGGFSLDLDDNFRFQNPANANALEKFSDQLNKYNIYNKDLYIYLWLPGLTNLQTECLAIYQGVVGDHTISGGRVNIKISNSTFIVNSDIPDLILESEYPGVILETVNTPKPEIYGNHSWPINEVAIADINLSEKASLIKCKLLRIVGDIYEYLVSGHAMKVLTVDDIWFYDSQSKVYFNCDPSIVTINNVDGNGNCTIEIDASSSINVTAYHFGYLHTSYSGGSYTREFSSIANQYDNNIATYSSTYIGIGELNAKIRTDILFKALNITGYDTAYANTVYCRKIFSGDSAHVVFQVNETDITITSETSRISCGTSLLPGTYIKVEYDSDGTGPGSTSTLSVYQVYKRLSYDFTFDDSRFSVCIAGSGRADDGSGTITGTPSLLIQNPSHVAESIARNNLGLTTKINTTKFDNVATELTNWLMNPIIYETINTQNLFDLLAKQCKSHVYFDANNTLSMDTFYAANTTSYTFQTNDIQGRPLLYKSPLSDIVNDFTLKYHKGAQGNLQSIISREDDRASVGSQAVYNAVMDMTMEADFISDATTAGLLADHWAKNDAASFWSVLHNVIEFETVDLRGVNFWNAGSFKPILGLELTDIIELHSDWDAKMELYGATWGSVQFKIFSITRLPDSLKIKAMSL